MIGAFARMLGNRERLLAVEETENHGYATRARTPSGVEDRREGTDSPPERFVEKVSDEGGDVYLVPFLDHLREWVRRRRAGSPGTTAEAASAPREETATLPRSSENR